MAGDIVPIELGLTDGDYVTLWAPSWREGDDEWEALLGHDEDLYGFESTAELAAFVRTNDDNDLVEHPSWKLVTALGAPEFEPEDRFRFDLIGVPELAASDPSADVVTELGETLDMARTIGDVCELDDVTKFFASNLVFRSLGAGPDAFVGREGEAAWDRIGGAIAQGWDAVLDAIDDVLASPEVDAEALAVAEAEIVAADENTTTTEDDTDEFDDDLEIDADDDDEDDGTRSDIAAAPVAPVLRGTVDEDEADEDDGGFWGEVGIDPIRIITTGQELFTLRCYVGDDAVFLGNAGRIFVFTTERALARFLADNHDHALARVSTYEQVQIAAVDGSLEIEVSDDNVYVLPGIADDLADGPTAVDTEQLELAVELFTDAADFAGDDAVDIALATSTPLGWYVSFLLEPDPSRLAPSAPFDQESQAWRDLEQEFETRLDHTE
ncbi:primosomal protein [Rhodococcus rhodnii]|uniref:Primosomal protein n=2 Tax=Rhodococcus rhodnii TaxID=38312 RepID=R7WJH7_9NOCA|nr:hypothetical protein [Rhodococcus rhodnii]EOM75443.1 hypothetical protein Rrhod_3241 [Rhodococcus rhodnii LMG 5362]TXG90531.1 primosomal protein [Rhodococcus rhodnii]